MDPPTCFECNKLGHIKVDCPQFKKKKLFKKKALKAWHLSDGEYSNDEVAEQVANLCFMASSDNEESDNEVDDSHTFGEFQFSFDELLVEFKKKGSQYSSLKKNMASIEKEKDLQVIENEHLKNDISILEHELAKKVDCVVKCNSCDNIDQEKEEESLKKKNVNLEKSFSKFILGSMKLQEMLAIQRPYLDKTGIGYTPLEVKAKLKNTKKRPYCTYCHKVGHVVDKCFKKIAHYHSHARNSPNHNTITFRQFWVPKGTIKQKCDINGPNKQWVPRSKLFNTFVGGKMFARKSQGGRTMVRG
ncbi:zf-CCHC domain-containing protein [Cephalotus follicularis]|uniref:Zf-CCHC domain-containing protein n=1 Tax=Cephalotus follicularis TaxID=3775 RepID=A0A1Q3DEG5_CEPFO|nr:zf-CCHC domain-containing protein [Cephalotus follicularis]